MQVLELHPTHSTSISPYLNGEYGPCHIPKSCNWDNERLEGLVSLFVSGLEDFGFQPIVTCGFGIVNVGLTSGWTPMSQRQSCSLTQAVSYSSCIDSKATITGSISHKLALSLFASVSCARTSFAFRSSGSRLSLGSNIDSRSSWKSGKVSLFSAKSISRSSRAFRYSGSYALIDRDTASDIHFH